jgi:hypothetical protein
MNEMLPRPQLQTDRKARDLTEPRRQGALDMPATAWAYSRTSKRRSRNEPNVIARRHGALRLLPDAFEPLLAVMQSLTKVALNRRLARNTEVARLI